MMMRACCLALMAALCSARAYGHEIGASQASAVFRGAEFQIDVVVDPDTLLSKLEAFGGRPVSHGLSRTERDSRIRELADVFLAETSVQFDGDSVRPRFEYLPVVGLQRSGAVALGDTSDRAHPTGRRPLSLSATAWRWAPMRSTFESAMGRSRRIGSSAAPRVSPSRWRRRASPLTRGDVARQYLALGFTHIVPHGLDHILFVLGIFLLTSRWRSVVAQVSTFTLAHSITLALTMYGIVSLPAKVIEPMIALSIVYVAIENLIVGELKPWRLALVFSFGLLHGMGFAGVLRDLGLPRPQFLTALVSFNVGVEAGQLTVIAVAFIGRRLLAAQPYRPIAASSFSPHRS